MKKIILTLVLVAGAFATKMNAQEVDNVVKINPLAMIVGKYEIAYERALSEKSTAQLDLGYQSFDFAGYEYSGFSVGAQYRYYFDEATWFAGPVVNY